MSRPASRQKVLVYLVGSLGDTLVAIPGLRVIRGNFPEAEIVLLHNEQEGHIVSPADVVPPGLVDRFMTYGGRAESRALRAAEFARLVKRIRAERFNKVVNLVDTERPSRSVVRDKFFFGLCGIPRRLGFGLFNQEELYPVEPSGRPAFTDHEAVRRVRRLERDGLNVDELTFAQPLLAISDGERKAAHNWLVERGASDALLAAIAPGCKQPANAWPTDRFVDIARQLVERGFQIVLLGGPKERDTSDQIVQSLGCGINAAGLLSVRQSAAVLSLSKLYVGLDTGSTHLAASVNTRCFAIYGDRLNPGQWYPLGLGHRLITHRVPCGGCHNVACPLSDHPCMLGIDSFAASTQLDAFIDTLDDKEAANMPLKIYEI